MHTHVYAKIVGAIYLKFFQALGLLLKVCHFESFVIGSKLQNIWAMKQTTCNCC